MNKELKGRDIIIIGLQAWDIEIGSNCKNIALEMAQDNRVLYVNNPLDIRTLLTRGKEAKTKKRLNVLRGSVPAIEQISDKLWTLNPRTLRLSSNWIKWKSGFDLVNKFNNRTLASEIRKAARTLGFSDYYLFNDNAIFLGQYQKKYLRPRKYIYYIRDNLSKNNYWHYHGARLEPAVIATADVVVTNSEYYRDYARASNPRSYMVGQGCDLTNFDPEINYGTPGDIPAIRRPIVGYVGYLSSRRLDIDLLVALAQWRPEWQFVLVGPEDEAFATSLLHQLANVFFLGAKSEELIPAYIRCFDVCFNPQLINEITVGNYPRKIDEYLAMGKPVVATATPAMNYFREHVYLGTTAADYETLIAAALSEDSPARRQARVQVARRHTWRHSVANIYQAINSV